MPLTGCTADSGRPAAELRSMDRSSLVRERDEPGEWPADRDDPDASDSFPAAQLTSLLMTCQALATCINWSCKRHGCKRRQEFISTAAKGDSSRASSAFVVMTWSSPSAAPGRKGAPRFRSVSCDSLDCAGTRSAVGTAQAEAPWLVAASAATCAQSAKAVHSFAA